MRFSAIFVAVTIVIFAVISSLMLASVAPHEAVGQLTYALVGVVCFLLLQFVAPQYIWKAAFGLYALAVVGLIVTLVIGRVSHGAMRWLPLGPVHIQVSEFAKPLLVLALGLFVVKYPLTTHKRIFSFFVLSALSIGPVFLQPDLGSAMVMSVGMLMVFYLGLARLRTGFPWGVAMILGAIFAWQFLLYPYQKDRLMSFVGTGAASYNARQALIAVGSGKLWGRGIGHGVQSGLRFLPEHHTDFFFASYVEELGFVGAMGLFVVYGVLFALVVRLLRSSSKRSTLVGAGILAQVWFQMVVHMGMNMRLFPITGIPLPFLSSGGSSFIALCLGIGMVVRLSSEKESHIQA